jgi:pimeloyl-ACP methyl ester carboxylesterase
LTSFVFLPGLDGTGQLFDRVLSLVDGASYVVVRYPESATSLQALVEVARDAINATECPVVIAESFSGAVLTSLLAEGDCDIRAAIFVASFAASPRPQLLRIAHRVPEAIARAAMATVVSGFCVNGRDSAELSGAVLQTLKLVPYQTLVKRLGFLRGLSGGVIATKVPVLALQASRERVLDRQAQLSVSRRFPAAKVEVVEGPHLLLHAVPGICWGAIQAFLKAHR